MLFWSVFPYSREQQWSISWLDVMCDGKWVLYDNLQWPAQWMGLEEAPKHFPKPNLHRKRKGRCLVDCCQIWSTTALWAPVKPLHLRSMLRKSMRCTENCNTCSWHWSTDRAQLISMTTPDCQNQATKASKVEQIGLWTFASSATFIWPLTNLLQLLWASWWLFTGKQASTTSKRQKIFANEFPESQSMDFYATGINKRFSLAKIVHCNGSYFE